MVLILVKGVKPPFGGFWPALENAGCQETITGRGDFQIAQITFNQVHRMAGCLHNLGIIRWDKIFRTVSIGPQKQSLLENLGCLCQPEPFSGEGCFDGTLAIGSFEGVNYGGCQNGCPIYCGSLENRVDVFFFNTGAHRVMDGDMGDLRTGLVQRVLNGIAPFLSSINHLYPEKRKVRGIPLQK